MIVLVFLLVVPEPSRVWFTPDELDQDEFGNADGDEDEGCQRPADDAVTVRSVSEATDQYSS
ncbi:hypothetical protein ACFYXC_12595 [Streptomyces sp. NPDC002701]|uniref:hypothetical protein n=1 Tax=Streptomyces sp. NPDC002701 TaxID=3364661 RepID=UPI0036B5E787